MTNNEILQADLLDILFDNRNKDYGAYVLRKEYSHRLNTALMTVLFIVIAASFIAMREMNSRPPQTNYFPVIDTVRTIELPREKPQKAEPSSAPKQMEKPTPAARIKATAQIEIIPDRMNIKTDVPDQNELAQKLISDHSADGPLPSNVPTIVNEPTPVEGNTGTAKPDKEFIKEESAPEFPGGTEALMRFFSRNLSTPDELSPGEMKTVLAKFKVDADGSISEIIIVKSGGKKYDEEILRVFKKMPKWKPAIQNGHKVAIYFTQPVTFMGIE
jgi:periplasmic protein TonB